VAANAADPTNITIEQPNINLSGMWFRVIYPDVPYLIFRSVGTGSAFSMSYQFIATSKQVSSSIKTTTWGDINSKTGDSGDMGTPVIFILMGAGGALVVVALIAITVWASRKCCCKSEKVTPEHFPLRGASMETENKGGGGGYKKRLTEEETKPPMSSADTEKYSRRAINVPGNNQDLSVKVVARPSAAAIGKQPLNQTPHGNGDLSIPNVTYPNNQTYD
jgi:hypothetical protein